MSVSNLPEWGKKQGNAQTTQMTIEAIKLLQKISMTYKMQGDEEAARKFSKLAADVGLALKK